MEESKHTIPGTRIKIGGFFSSAFSGGIIGNLLSPFLGYGSGLLLSQITHIAEDLTKETIQNWVKRNLVDPPRNGKFYDENQVARILILNSLRSVIELEDIKLLMEYVLDKSNGTVMEKELLDLFNRSVVKTKEIYPGNLPEYEKALSKEITQTLGKKEGDTVKIKNVILIMLTAYHSNLLKKQADNLIFGLKTNT